MTYILILYKPHVQRMSLYIYVYINLNNSIQTIKNAILLIEEEH